MATEAEHSSAPLVSQQSPPKRRSVEHYEEMHETLLSHPTSFVQLKGLIANTWCSIQVQELESLAAFMPKRIAAVIRAKGDLLKVTKY